MCYNINRGDEMTLKGDILELHGKEPGLANYQIAERLNTDRRIVWSAINNYQYKKTKAYKNKMDSESIGLYLRASKQIPEYLSNVIMQEIKEHPECSYKEISQKLMVQPGVIKLVLFKHEWGTPIAQYMGRLRLSSVGRVRIEILTHYGNGIAKCAMCGIEDMRVLTIDHINGGGKKHRESINKKAGHDFYKWLKDNAYPDGYQVLCANCQWIKRIENNEYKRS
jgi:hypothetical protein